MKILLTYFKTSGKYYTSADYVSEWNSDYLWRITEEVRLMQAQGRLPGLTAGGGQDFTILVQADEDDAVPALVKPSSPMSEETKSRLGLHHFERSDIY